MRGRKTTERRSDRSRRGSASRLLRCVVVAVAMPACGSSIPAETHQRLIAEQRAAYEDRLFAADRARRTCETTAARDAKGAEAKIASLSERVRRLERATDRSADAKPIRVTGLAAQARQAVGAVGSWSTAVGGARWVVPIDVWFDAGSTRVRADAAGAGALDRLAAFLARRPRFDVEVRVPRAGAFLAVDAEPAWREAHARGVALLARVQERGVAPSRLTLAVHGDLPQSAVVWMIVPMQSSRRRGASVDRP